MSLNFSIKKTLMDLDYSSLWAFSVSKISLDRKCTLIKVRNLPNENRLYLTKS